MSEADTSPQPIRIGGKTALAQFSCAKCGARLEYAPGTKVLRCPYCQFENEIPQAVTPDGDAAVVQEHDLVAALNSLEHEAPTHSVGQVECGACKAIFTPAPNITATTCPFCGANIVMTEHAATVIKPGAILPFKIARDRATDLYRGWVRSRWFAPNRLKSQAMLDASLRGLYIPAWTYDAHAVTRYTGERGDAYYVTVGSGNNRRTERRIRWSPASGVVSNDFDDVLVLASRSLPTDKADALEPWDLADVVPYDDAYLAGFTAESYTVTLPEGFARAKEIMAEEIRSTVRADIGGDEQRIHSMDTDYSGLMYKHILLPVWLSAYRFNERVFRFLVNARTGEVQGERPYSWIKITLAVLAALIMVLVIVWLTSSR